MTKKWTIFVLAVFLSGITACTATGGETSSAARNPVHVEIEMRDDLKQVSNETMVSQADAIFLGRVDWVGNTVQVNGSTHHQLAVTVLHSIIDEADIGSGAILTMVGPSPVDNEAAPSTAAMKPDNLAKHNLHVGDEVIFFVQESQISQEGRSQIVLTPFSDIRQSILSAEQFNSLILQVQQQRPSGTNPVLTEELGAY